MSPYLTHARRATTRGELEIDWGYPLWAPKTESSGDRTVAAQPRHALAAEAVYAFISGEDRRPLLVLRDCLTCTGTDDALLTRQADNEKTLLLTRWFHCIRLPADVLEADHPFHELFAGEDPGHLFVSSWDGSNRKDLNGAQSRTELWSAMGGLLGSEYESGHETALRQLLNLLDRFDGIDQRIEELERALDSAVEREGPGGAKVTKMKKELVRLEEERSELRAEAARLSELELRPEKRA